MSSQYELIIQLLSTIAFLEGGKALNTFIRDKIIRTGSTEIIKRSILAAVYAGIALPLTVISTASLLLDGEFVRCHVSPCSLVEIFTKIELILLIFYFVT